MHVQGDDARSDDPEPVRPAALVEEAGALEEVDLLGDAHQSGTVLSRQRAGDLRRGVVLMASSGRFRFKSERHCECGGWADRPRIPRGRGTIRPWYGAQDGKDVAPPRFR
ncbi:hypothetical protein GCM10020254_06280 [Streptomyces goshikiensis]